MAKLNSLGVRLKPEVRVNLEKIAAEKRWSLSQAAAIAVEEWIRWVTNGSQKEPRKNGNGGVK